jgi:hypothetical protein
MKKVIRETDEKRGIVQITVADERWYTKPGKDPASGIPVYTPVPSVTWIAGFWPKGVGFYKWLADKGWDEAEAAKQAAGDKGSRVHLAIERILRGEEFRIDTKVEDKSRSTEDVPAFSDLTYEELLCVNSFLAWRRDTEQDYEMETIANEITVFSEIHGYAGTVDWVVRLTPKAGGSNPLKLSGPTPYVIDFKTSKQVWKEYELQVSAYRVALENGENPLFERNENGTESNKVVDLSGLRTAILQVGYDKNKDGYKFTEIEDAFPLFKIAQQIWREEHTSKRNGELLTPGFTKRDFPIVLSPAAKKAADVGQSIPDSSPERGEVEQPAPEVQEEAAPAPRRRASSKK